MSLEIQQRQREGIDILDLKGRITVGAGVTHFREKMEALVSAGVNNVILNLQGVDYIDSTGLGVLVWSFSQMRKAGGAAKLLHLNRRHIELLVMTKLTTVFEIFNDEQDAVNSFFPDREIKRFDILDFIRGQEEQDKS